MPISLKEAHAVESFAISIFGKMECFLLIFFSDYELEARINKISLLRASAIL